MARVLVTGGAGFIGSHLVSALRRRGDEVRVLDDLSTGKRGNLPDGVALVVGDVVDEAAVRRATEGVEIVFHLAAIASIAASARDGRRAHAVNLEGTTQVLRCVAERRRPCRVVFASSAAVYGEAARLPLAEDDPTAPVSLYGKDKLAGERQARETAAAGDVTCVGLRIFNAYGPRQDAASPYSGVISRFVDRMQTGQDLTIHGSGAQTRDFVFVDDVVACFLWAAGLKHGGLEIFNVCTGRGTRINDLASVVSSFREGGAKVSHAPARSDDVANSIGNIEKLARFGGPVPTTPLRSGIAATIKAKPDGLP